MKIGIPPANGQAVSSFVDIVLDVSALNKAILYLTVLSFIKIEKVLNFEMR